MKITASNTQVIQPKVSPINNNNVAEGVLKLDDKNVPSFSERLSSGLDRLRILKMKPLSWQKTLNLELKMI